MSERIVPITDDRGRRLIPEEDLWEPLPGSLVLTEGLHGTAWQRFFSDNLWHRMGGGAPRRWEDLITRRNLVLVYDAPERPMTAASLGLDPVHRRSQ